MEKQQALTMVVLALAVVGFTAAAFTESPAKLSAAPLNAGTGTLPSAHPALAAASLPPPTETFPRTVLAEAFTAQWCEWCPEESHAMYTIEHQSSPGVINVGELHVCYSESDCGDNYNTVDNTSLDRQVYYDVSGIPTVAFDGVPIVGSNANESILLGVYESAVANASAVPGNVLITQSATFTSGTNVSVNETITSGVTGTFHALSYLVELIGKNISSTGGVHDIENVVRESVINSNVELTAGQTTGVVGTAPLSAGWNLENLSVISFVQDNTTKAVENANMVPVTNLLTTVSSDPSVSYSGKIVNVTVTAANTSTGAPVPGATVTLSSNAGGTFGASVGSTDSVGEYTTTFTAPVVTALTSVSVVADVSAPGYVSSSGSSDVLVNPVSPPGAPTNLGLVPVEQQVDLSWYAPGSGGNGVTYHIYRSVSQSGGYSEVGMSTTPSFVDTSASPGVTYWYKLAASNTGGFSVNTTALSASSVTVSAQGLPASDTWTLAIASTTFTATPAATISFFLSDGLYPYSITASSYEYVAAPAFGNATIADAPMELSATFGLRTASLDLTVIPATATVSIRGTAVPVVDGTVEQSNMAAGTYAVVVASSGYVTNTTTITLTWGNLTTLAISLSPVHSPPGSNSGGSSSSVDGIADWELGAILAVIALVGIGAAVGGYMVPRRRKGASTNPKSDPDKPSP